MVWEAKALVDHDAPATSPLQTEPFGEWVGSDAGGGDLVGQRLDRVIAFTSVGVNAASSCSASRLEEQIRPVEESAPQRGHGEVVPSGRHVAMLVEFDHLRTGECGDHR